MLNLISRLGETRPEQEWSNATEFSGYSDFPEFYTNNSKTTRLRLVVHEFFSSSTNIPRGLSTYNP